MLTCDEHDAVVSRLYSAAAGETDWVAALGATADRFGTAAAVLVAVGIQGSIINVQTHGKPLDFALAFYQSETYLRDPRSAYHLAVAPGDVYHDHGLYDVPTMLRHDRVRATIDMIGVAHQMGVSLRLPRGAPGMFTLLSTEAEGAADEEMVAAFQRLAPHIEQACALGEIVERAASTQAMLLEAMAAKADGVILLNAAGTPAFVNGSAQAILAAGDGLGWTPEGFVTRRAAETRRLRHLVRSAIAGRFETGRGGPGGQLLVTRPSARRPYILRVLPAPPVERFLSTFGFACVIHIHDLGAVRVPSRALLIAAFGLTEREADLAVELVRCAGLAGAATGAGMAHNTARNHLQGIFRKCAVANQAEAVQLFSRFA